MLYTMIVGYLIIVNLIGLLLMGMDKSRAKRQEWRIPEKTLFACALLGGSLGTTVGMYMFRHKTKHWYFKYGMPAIFVMQVVLLNYLSNLLYT